MSKFGEDLDKKLQEVIAEKTGRKPYKHTPRELKGGETHEVRDVMDPTYSDPDFDPEAKAQEFAGREKVDQAKKAERVVGRQKRLKGILHKLEEIDPDDPDNQATAENIATAYTKYEASMDEGDEDMDEAGRRLHPNRLKDASDEALRADQMRNWQDPDNIAQRAEENEKYTASKREIKEKTMQQRLMELDAYNGDVDKLIDTINDNHYAKEGEGEDEVSVLDDDGNPMVLPGGLHLPHGLPIEEIIRKEVQWLMDDFEQRSIYTHCGDGVTNEVPENHTKKDYAALQRIRMPMIQSENGSGEDWTTTDILLAMRAPIRSMVRGMASQPGRARIHFDRDEVFQNAMEGVLKAVHTDKGIAPFGMHARKTARDAANRGFTRNQFRTPEKHQLRNNVYERLHAEGAIAAIEQDIDDLAEEHGWDAKYTASKKTEEVNKLIDKTLKRDLTVSGSADISNAEGEVGSLEANFSDAEGELRQIGVRSYVDATGKVTKQPITPKDVVGGQVKPPGTKVLRDKNTPLSRVSEFGIRTPRMKKGTDRRAVEVFGQEEDRNEANASIADALTKYLGLRVDAGGVEILRRLDAEAAEQGHEGMHDIEDIEKAFNDAIDAGEYKPRKGDIISKNNPHLSDKAAERFAKIVWGHAVEDVVSAARPERPLEADDITIKKEQRKIEREHIDKLFARAKDPANRDPLSLEQEMVFLLYLYMETPESIYNLIKTLHGGTTEEAKAETEEMIDYIKEVDAIADPDELGKDKKDKKGKKQPVKIMESPTRPRRKVSLIYRKMAHTTSDNTVTDKWAAGSKKLMRAQDELGQLKGPWTDELKTLKKVAETTASVEKDLDAGRLPGPTKIGNVAISTPMWMLLRKWRNAGSPKTDLEFSAAANTISPKNKLAIQKVLAKLDARNKRDQEAGKKPTKIPLKGEMNQIINPLIHKNVGVLLDIDKENVKQMLILHDKVFKTTADVQAFGTPEGDEAEVENYWELEYNNRYTPDIIALSKQGLSISQIADAMDMSTDHVSRYLKENNKWEIYRNRIDDVHQLLDAGHSPEEVATAITEFGKIASKDDEFYYTFTPQDIETFRTLSPDATAEEVQEAFVEGTKADQNLLRTYRALILNAKMLKRDGLDYFKIANKLSQPGRTVTPSEAAVFTKLPADPSLVVVHAALDNAAEAEEKAAAADGGAKVALLRKYRELIVRATELEEDGYSNREIAKELGITPTEAGIFKRLHPDDNLAKINNVLDSVNQAMDEKSSASLKNHQGMITKAKALMAHDYSDEEIATKLGITSNEAAIYKTLESDADLNTIQSALSDATLINHRKIISAIRKEFDQKLRGEYRTYVDAKGRSTDKSSAVAMILQRSFDNPDFDPEILADQFNLTSAELYAYSRLSPDADLNTVEATLRNAKDDYEIIQQRRLIARVHELAKRGGADDELNTQYIAQELDITPEEVEAYKSVGVHANPSTIRAQVAKAHKPSEEMREKVEEMMQRDTLRTHIEVANKVVYSIVLDSMDDSEHSAEILNEYLKDNE
jgi:predicted transcriptional regulator